tara:strand:+ start:290 stop:1771 length:1482 start_codon:yes stop_codon:yes gene_type:complete
MILNNIDSIAYFIPELLLVAGILAVILFDLSSKLKRYVHAIALVSILLTQVVFAINNNFIDQPISLFMGMIVIDPFANYFKWIIQFSTFFIVLLSPFDKSIDSEYRSEYNALILVTYLGLLLMVSSINLVMIYLAIELVSIPSYILAGFTKNNKESNEASLKYIIFGSFASGLMLFGLSWLYGIAGSTDIYVISSALSSSSSSLMIYISLILVLVGFGYKISMFPFHYWTPDVYQGAPTPVTAYLSVAPKAAGIGILIRVFYVLFTDQGGVLSTTFIHDVNWPFIMAVLSACTMTIGNILAIQQDNVKRILAYSSIAHVGFMLMAFSVVSVESIQAIMLYVFIYMFMNLAAFFVVIFISNATGASDVDDWNGVGLRSPLIAACMTITLVSLAGLPPASGFIGKFYLFATLFREGSFFWLAIIAILNSVISLYYYFRIVRAMYLVGSDNTDTIEMDPILKYSIVFFAAQNLLFYLYWDPLVYNVIKNSIVFFTG